MDLRFVNCPYCGKPFAEDDDVVFCPDCGAPGHRACWKAQGHCLYTDRHAEGYTWEIPYSAEREAFDRKAQEEEAARRAQAYAAGADQDNRPDGLPFDNEYGNYASYTTGDHGEMRPTQRVIGPEEMLGDFRVREYGDVVQKNKNKYIPKFFIMDRTKRNFTPNLAAFLFPIFWSTYRRMYGLAVLLILAHVIVPLFSFDSVMEYYSEGFRLVQEYAMTNADSASEEAMEALAQKMPAQPLALQINSYVSLAISILMGMFANTIYKKRCEQLLTKAKTIEDDAKRADFLKRRGGTSVLAVILMAALLFTAVNLLVSFGINQGFDQSVAETTTKAATEAAKAAEALISLWR